MKIRIWLVLVVASMTVAIFLIFAPKPPDRTLTTESSDEFLADTFQYPEMDISSGVEELEFKFELEPSLKFVPDTPPEVAVESSNTDVIGVGASMNKFPEKPFTFPVTARPGNADVTISYKVFCCTTKDTSICFFREGKIIVPVNVSETGKDRFEIIQTIDE